MATPRFEVPSGTIDGVNTTFTVSTPYQPGSSAVFINGMLMREDLVDGWYETNPAAGIIDLKEAPRVGPSGMGCEDVIQVFFLDTSPTQIDTSIHERICGFIEPVAELEGFLFGELPLEGVVEPVDLSGVLGGERLIVGEVEGLQVLQGTLEVCG
jgi:hypothetical protein